MAYVRRLIHRAAVHRPDIEPSVTGIRKADFPDEPVEGLESVPCLLVEQNALRMAQIWGAELKADAIVLFLSGVDIRPNPAQSQGTNDKLVVTDENDVTTAWLVKATRNPASARRMLVAAVVRAEH